MTSKYHFALKQLNKMVSVSIHSVVDGISLFPQEFPGNSCWFLDTRDYVLSICTYPHQQKPVSCLPIFLTKATAATHTASGPGSRHSSPDLGLRWIRLLTVSRFWRSIGNRIDWSSLYFS